MALDADTIRDSYNSALHHADLGIVATSGGLQAAESRPVDVSEGLFESDNSLFVVQERVDTLDAPLPVDILVEGGRLYGDGDGAAGAGGLLPTGTQYTSYLIHFDPVGDPQHKHVERLRALLGEDPGRVF